MNTVRIVTRSVRVAGLSKANAAGRARVVFLYPPSLLSRTRRMGGLGSKAALPKVSGDVPHEAKGDDSPSPAAQTAETVARDYGKLPKVSSFASFSRLVAIFELGTCVSVVTSVLLFQCVPSFVSYYHRHYSSVPIISIVLPSHVCHHRH